MRLYRASSPRAKYQFTSAKSRLDTELLNATGVLAFMSLTAV